MSQEITQFERKIVDFLNGHYNQEFIVGNRSKTETKRLSKAKNDIISRITGSMQGFMLLSEMIRISNVTPDKITGTDKGKKYIRENYTNLNPEIIKATLSFDLVGKEHALQHFKALQRNLASDIYNLGMTRKLFKAIFAFHPQGITRHDIDGRKIYKNASDIADTRYKEQHKKYYRDLASLLVETGIKEIKKNLHPDKDKALMDNLDLTVNMIKRLDYNVDEIKQQDIKDA